MSIATEFTSRALLSCQYVGELLILGEVLAHDSAIPTRVLTSHPGYDLANQTVYLDDMLRWGLGWLIKVS